MWLNPDGIANLLSAGLLEAEGYTIEYKTGGDWTVTAPTGEKIVFQRESEGVLQGFPFIKMNENPTGVALFTANENCLFLTFLGAILLVLS